MKIAGTCCEIYLFKTALVKAIKAGDGLFYLMFSISGPVWLLNDFGLFSNRLIRLIYAVVNAAHCSEEEARNRKTA